MGLRIICGAARIVRLLRSLERKGEGMVHHRVAWLDGEPAIVCFQRERVAFTTSVETDGTRLTVFYRVLNPDKLRHG